MFEYQKNVEKSDWKRDKLLENYFFLFEEREKKMKNNLSKGGARSKTRWGRASEDYTSVKKNIEV